jgi:predicted nucleic acid-binding protein
MEVNLRPPFLDTNVIVRHLLGEPSEQADEASRIIEEAEDLQVSGVALTETAFVLRSVYRVSRETIVDNLIDLVQRDNISIYAMDKNLVLEGLMMCRPSGRVSIGDAMIWAAARSDRASAIYTFDRRFPGEGIEIRQTL